MKTARYPSSCFTSSHPEHDSPLIFLEVLCKFKVHQVTEVHQVPEADCFSTFIRLAERPLPCFDLFRHKLRVCFVNFSHFWSTAALASGIFKATWIEIASRPRPKKKLRTYASAAMCAQVFALLCRMLLCFDENVPLLSQCMAS